MEKESERENKPGGKSHIHLQNEWMIKKSNIL